MIDAMWFTGLGFSQIRAGINGPLSAYMEHHTMNGLEVDSKICRRGFRVK
jgi:hypothetical protein